MALEINAPITRTRTCLKTIKFCHEWTIENFISFFWSKPPEGFIESSKFSPKDNDQVKFTLRIFPGNPEKTNQAFAVYLYGESRGTISAITLMSKIYLVDINNTNKHSIEESGTISKDNMYQKLPLIVTKTSLMAEANVLLPDDKLTIFCEIVMPDNIVMISGEGKPINAKLSMPQINDDFGKLFETHSLSDVTLTVDGKDIRAHKAVLAARSPVFLAMFQNDMEELKNNCVKINDINYKVFMEMLRFMYTDEAPNLQIMATDLLTVADKYVIEKLKFICAEVLSKSLKVENAVEILVLSHLHNADPLKDAVINFICDQLKYITVTASFKSMAESYPYLVVEIVNAMSKKAMD